ncbi:inositol-1-monophosphatase [Candidatus Gillettellia adelgis]
MHPMLTIAVRAARKAGDLIAKNYEMSNTIAASQEEVNNFIAHVNRDAEHVITRVIRKSYPKHNIFTGNHDELLGVDQDVQWVVYALDGASNFMKHFPHFSVSIAVRIKNRTEVGVVYDPMRNELFTASRGYGAQLNGYRLRGNHSKSLDGAILAIGFPVQHKQSLEVYIKIIGTLFNQCADFRHTGSSTLDLAYVAAGRVDGFFNIGGIKPGVFTAAELLVRESGGFVSDFAGDHHHLSSGNLIAGNARILKSILFTIRTELQNTIKI